MPRNSARRSRRHSRRRWPERLRALLDYELLWTILAVLLIVVVISPQIRLRIREYSPGDVAVTDITAPIDLRVRDPVSTERRRMEAVARVPDVYDFNPNTWSTSKAILHGFFEWGRNAIAETSVPWSQLDDEQRAGLLEAAAAAAGRPLPEGLVEALWRNDAFALTHELQVAGRIMNLLQSALIGGLEPTLADGGSSIIVRDITDQRERTVADLSNVIDPAVARMRLRAEVIERLDLEAETERLLADLGASLLLPNLTYNSNETQTRRRQAYESVAPAFYQVKRGRTLVRAGDAVTNQQILELEALQAQTAGERSLGSLAGTTLIVALAVIALWRFLTHYRNRFRYQKVERLYLLALVVLVGMVVLTRVSLFIGEAMANSLAQEPFNVAEAYRYGIPFAAGGLLLLLLVDLQVAWGFSAIFAVLVGAMTSDLPLTLFALLGSFAAIYSMSQYKQRTALVRAGSLIGAINVVAVVGLALLSSPLPPWTIIAFQGACALAGGVLVSMVVTTGLPPLEHCFQCLTDIKLLELSNMNLPLLKDLAVAAPGTYHHSVVVGTLAEAAAEVVGVNPLFARVSAYYHDIGKLRQPEYFIENQRDGRNPHDNLSPHMSALILVSHIKEGIAYAEEHGLPQPLIDMIPQHHGTRMMAFFYDRAQQQVGDTGAPVNPDEFRYPGPRPQSKEAAILMLADSVEATSRTVTDPTPSRLRTMIRNTIRDVVEDEQLIECGLTLADLSRITDAFLGVLAGMQHQRIEYPSTPREDPEQPAESGDEVASFADEDSGTQLPGETYH